MNQRRLATLLLAGAFSSGLAMGADPEQVAAGFVFVKPASGKAVIREAPDGGAKVVGEPPAGARLVYRKLTKSTSGTPTWYRVEPPGSAPGWLPAGDTSLTRPTVPPPARPVNLLDSGVGNPRPTSAQTAAASGLSNSARDYAKNKQELKLSVDQFLTLEKTVEKLYTDEHDPKDGSYPDTDPKGQRRAKAAAFKADLK